MQRLAQKLASIVALVVGGSLLGSLSLNASSAADAFSRRDRDLMRRLSESAWAKLRQNYYAPDKLTNDIEHRFRSYVATLETSASLDEAQIQFADLLASLGDGQTRYIPPRRSVQFRHPWSWSVVGPTVFVTQVTPNSHAANAGLEVGQRALSIDGMPLDRSSSDPIRYLLQVLVQRPVLRVEIESETGQAIVLSVAAESAPPRDQPELLSVGNGYAVRSTDSNGLLSTRQPSAFRDGLPSAFAEVNDVAIWRVPDIYPRRADFTRLSSRLQDKRTLVIDLRGCGSGNFDGAAALAGLLFAREIECGTIMSKSRATPLLTNDTRGAEFSGNVVVLIDHGTRGAAEILSRILQNSRRAVIVGDDTPGETLACSRFSLIAGSGVKSVAAEIQVPEEDFRFPDGTSIHRTGVRPDLKVVPSGDDLKAERDVTLARAMSVMGHPTTPVQLNSVRWTEL